MRYAIQTTLPADLASSGTVNVGYPTNTNSGTFAGAPGKHSLVCAGGEFSVAKGDFTVSFGAANITVTWANALTLKAGTRASFEFAAADRDNIHSSDVVSPNFMLCRGVVVDFGKVEAVDDDGLFAATLLGSAGNFTLNGALVTGGVAVFDVPRTVQFTVATTNQSGVTLTVEGYDGFNAFMVETLAGPNANTVETKRAFKKVTRVAASAAVATNGIKAGSGVSLGLPFRLPAAGYALKAMVDGVDELATSTITAGLGVKPTATNGDIRGTVKFNTSLVNTKQFQLLALAPDVTDVGAGQYVG